MSQSLNKIVTSLPVQESFIGRHAWKKWSKCHGKSYGKVMEFGLENCVEPCLIHNNYTSAMRRAREI